MKTIFLWWVEERRSFVSRTQMFVSLLRRRKWKIKRHNANRIPRRPCWWRKRKSPMSNRRSRPRRRFLPRWRKRKSRRIRLRAKKPTGNERRKKKMKTSGAGKRSILLFSSLTRWSFRWEEEKYTDGRKWSTLEHKGPLFPPAYDSLPSNVKFFYNGIEVKLKDPAEEIMTFYARMLDHDYTSKDVFNTNFLADWRKAMSQAERETIKDLKKCDFTQVANYFKEQTEQRKAMSKEDKKKIKDENEKIRKEYGFCMWDKHRQPVGNYKIEPPGLFRGRGEHPKMGCVKKRIRPEDVIINIGREAQIPKPPEGHHWKEVRHDNKVSWLVMWTENIRGNNKYIMLNASSRVKVGSSSFDAQQQQWFREFRANVIGRSMKRRGNFIERSTRYGRTIRSIGRAKKCASVNVLSLSTSSTR